MGIANYVRNGRRFGDRKCSLGAKIPKMSLRIQASRISSAWEAAAMAVWGRGTALGCPNTAVQGPFSLARTSCAFKTATVS